jgi:hypothetical protein
MTYTPSQPLTAAGLKALPKPVAERVKQLQQQHRIRGATWRVQSANDTLYLDEDQTYDLYRNGEWHSIRMAGEWNMTASALANPISAAVGQRVPVAVGTFVIEHGFGCGGRYHINVMHWSVEQLEAAHA